jgi:hypothetical protein
MRDPRHASIAAWSAWRRPETRNLWQWMEANFVPVGSARAAEWKVSISPWLKEPAEWVDDGNARKLTLVMPAQSGKSTLGEGAICKWIAHEMGGDVQYNWEDDEKGRQRYKKRVRQILQASPPVKDLWPRDRRHEENGLIIFAHLNFTMQGVYVTSNLESDAVKKQVNEEIHAWESGRLYMADRRQDAYRDSPGVFQLNISTGGVVGDQLHQRWEESTQQLWMEPCSKCGGYQHFHIRTEEGKKGGLRYDSSAGKLADGSYDYDAIAETVHYECEHCGHQMRDDPNERRERSLAGRYSDPAEGSTIEQRGAKMESVSIPWIPWIDLIQAKHVALAKLRQGDTEAMKVYIQRIEAGFHDPESRPIVGELQIREGAKKREPSMPEPEDLRLMSADYQRGQARLRETEHFWAVIRDWRVLEDGRIRSTLVWEGRVWSKTELEALRESYGVEKRFCALDCSDNQDDLLRFIADFADPEIVTDRDSVAMCGDGTFSGLYTNCWTGLKGEGGAKWYKHPDTGMRKRYSPMQKRDPYLGTANRQMGLVPLILYSEQLSHDLLNFCRTSDRVEWIDPEDVSADYREHMDSYERLSRKTPTGEIVYEWHRIRKRQDLYICNTYQCMQAEFAGLVGVGAQTTT